MSLLDMCKTAYYQNPFRNESKEGQDRELGLLVKGIVHPKMNHLLTLISF